MPLLAALRSDRRRPVRCGNCGELSYLPSVATLLVGATLELLLMAALLLSEWLSGINILYAAGVFTVVLIGGTATLWPLRPVPPRGGKLSFSRPSPA
ncbi:hypothetical protein [Roseateles sp.]|uniref:hypothetical protein n=1 Tax=Roseateles sp. TaxID=1971397 RepID=UPI002F408DBC